MNVGGSGGVVKPLSHDAVFRIEVSLSSQRSSAIVMRTTARLYSLEGTNSQGGSTGDVEWKSVAYGVPCLQLMKEDNTHNSPFDIKLVIAEVESGISLWEDVITSASGYQVMQNNFHTFKNNGKTFAVQFASENEAGRMIESLEDLLLQKQKSETVSFDTKNDDIVFKKPKPLSRRLSKKDISAPCNFKHVSGITLQRTQTCEEELRGTIQRKMRSMSLSSLPQKRVKHRPPLPDDMVNGFHGDHTQQAQGPSPEITRKDHQSKESGKKSLSVRHKLGSFRKKKSVKGGGVTVTILDDSAITEGSFARDSNQRSLPSHYRQQVRPLLEANTFVPPHTNRALSHSSEDLADLPTTKRAQPLERRHTVYEHSAQPQRAQYNYTPYSARGDGDTQKQYMSDMSLNRMPPARMTGGQQPILREAEASGPQRSASEASTASRQVSNGWRGSVAENGLMSWKERGWVGPGIEASYSMSRSMGSIHTTGVPPPLPPPNQSKTSVQSIPHAQLPNDQVDPQPYATIAYKARPKSKPQNVTPSEYDILTPRTSNRAQLADQPSVDSQPHRYDGHSQHFRHDGHSQHFRTGYVKYPTTHQHSHPGLPQHHMIPSVGHMTSTAMQPAHNVGHMAPSVGHMTSSAMQPAHNVGHMVPSVGHMIPSAGHMTSSAMQPGHMISNVRQPTPAKYMPRAMYPDMYRPYQPTMTHVSYSSHTSRPASSSHRAGTPLSPSHPSTQVYPIAPQPVMEQPFAHGYQKASLEQYDVLALHGKKSEQNVSGEFRQYSPQMTRALEDFDHLLTSRPNKAVTQTSL